MPGKWHHPKPAWILAPGGEVIYLAAHDVWVSVFKLVRGCASRSFLEHCCQFGGPFAVQVAAAPDLAPFLPNSHLRKSTLQLSRDPIDSGIYRHTQMF